MLFGIYLQVSDGDYEFTADKLDMERKDLVGCATMYSFYWEDYRYVDEEGSTFTEENVLAALRGETETLSEWYTEYRKRRPKNPRDNVEGSVFELFDLYHAWRSLIAIKQEIASGAEVYETVNEVMDAIDDLAGSVLAALTKKCPSEDFIPEEIIIERIKS
jgi:hypothetical protein